MVRSSGGWRKRNGRPAPVVGVVALTEARSIVGGVRRDARCAPASPARGCRRGAFRLRRAPHVPNPNYLDQLTVTSADGVFGVLILRPQSRGPCVSFDSQPRLVRVVRRPANILPWRVWCLRPRSASRLQDRGRARPVPHVERSFCMATHSAIGWWQRDRRPVMTLARRWLSLPWVHRHACLAKNSFASYSSRRADDHAPDGHVGFAAR